MNTRKTVVITDSCVGGIGILKEIISWAGDFDIVYFADYEKNPFGLKNQKEIQDIVRMWSNKFAKIFPDLAMIVVACNTASIAAESIIPSLIKTSRIPIITMIEGVESCLSVNKDFLVKKNIGVMATKYSIVSNRYGRLLDEYKPNKIIGVIGTKTEHIVASGEVINDVSKNEIEKELKNASNLDVLILACTCYKLIEKRIQDILPHTKLIDPSSEVSAVVKDYFKINKSAPVKEIRFYTSGEVSHMKNALEPVKGFFYGINYEIKKLIIR